MDSDEYVAALDRVITELASIRGALDQLAGVVRRLRDASVTEHGDPATVHPIRPGEDQ